MNSPKNRGNYFPKLIALGQELHALAPGVYLVNVRHDEWCALLSGRGDCNCDPDVEPERVKPRSKGSIS